MSETSHYKKSFFDAFKHNAIARRITLYVILFSSFATLIFTAHQLYSDYTDDMLVIENNFATIEETQIALMSNSIWSLNDQQVQIQLDALLQLQDIEYVAVVDTGGIKWFSGEPLAKNYKERSFPIEFIRNGRSNDIGTLLVRVSIDSVYERIEERLISLLLNNGLRTFLVALFMLIIVQSMVTRHLNKISDYAKSIDINDEKKQKLKLERSEKTKGNSDELENVVNSINLMHSNMVDTHLKLRESEKKLSVMLHNAEAANRSKSDFLAAMSHDLRTPLNAILGFSEMMKSQMLGPLGSDRYTTYASDIHHSGKYLLELINDILDISKIEAGERIIQKSDVDLRNIVLNCLDMTKLHTEAKNLECSLDIDEKMKPVFADHQALMQIMMNLISNAIKFTPDSGTITVSAHTENKSHVIKVSDTGIGISAENLKTITDPFTRVEDDPYKTNEGTGLGLAIVKSLIELHEGSLEINSTLGKGTSVTVTIPTK